MDRKRSKNRGSVPSHSSPPSKVPTDRNAVAGSEGANDFRWNFPTVHLSSTSTETEECFRFLDDFREGGGGGGGDSSSSS